MQEIKNGIDRTHLNIRMEESDFFFDAYRISFQILDDVPVHL